MRRSVTASMFGLFGALAVAGYGHDVIAQGALLVNGNTANNGVLNLAPGFPTDPTNRNVVSGGDLDASSMGLGAGCTGFVTRQPDLILRMSGNSPTLRIYATVAGAQANAPSDTTLIINAADGRWHCNDDSYGGANPTVDLANAGAGQYDIWLGSYRPRANARAVLHITELDNHP